MKENLINLIKIIALSLILVVGISYISASGPAVLPPLGNIPAPINTTNAEQTKIGELRLGGLNIQGGTLFYKGGLSAPLKIVDGNQAEGKVLTSDGNGGATWQYLNCGTSTSTSTPSTPTGLSTAAGDCGIINISWSTSTNATSYTLKDGATVIYTGVMNLFSHTGLTLGSNHSYTVRATNASGASNYSSPAVNVTVPTECTSTNTNLPPSTPVGLVANPDPNCDSGKIYIGWYASAGATSYTLRDGGTIIYTGSATTFTHTGLVAESIHTYTVTATNSKGSSAQSAEVSAPVAPACPSPIPPATCDGPINADFPTLISNISDLAKRQWWRNSSHTAITYGISPNAVEVNSINGLPGGSFASQITPEALKRRIVVKMMQQLDEEIRKEYTTGVWVRFPNDIEGSTEIYTFNENSYRDIIPASGGYGWFRNINTDTFDFENGTVSNPGLMGFPDEISVNSSYFCGLINASLGQMENAIIQMTAVKVQANVVETNKWNPIEEQVTESCDFAAFLAQIDWLPYGAWLAGAGIFVSEETWLTANEFYPYHVKITKGRGKIQADLSAFAPTPAPASVKSYLKVVPLSGEGSNEILSPVLLDSFYHAWEVATIGGVWTSEYINNDYTAPDITSNCPSGGITKGWTLSDQAVVVQGTF
ncbi:hypothetical protein IT397_01425 [Candidatus Nomurabacteria bacterium]|nr:hypothetical protein [Candidatus Nomurabacteria bacterium]